MKQSIVLVILDGWGIGSWNESNPIYMAEPKTLNRIQAYFPAAALQASGIAVGLPWEEEGNSEVGHLTLGSGKVMYQHFPKISMAIENGSFFENETLKNAFDHAKKHASAVHLIGLLCEGNVHASLKHVNALLEMAKRENSNKVYLHAFTDGKDSGPKSAKNLIKTVRDLMTTLKIGTIASVIGRHYAMNRDAQWERTKEAYLALLGEGRRGDAVEDVIQKTYERGQNDEFVVPTIIGEPRPVGDNDAVIFFNFREDSMRQITEAFLDPSFDKFPVKKLKNVFVATFTEYDERFKARVVFPRESVGNPLGRVLASSDKKQLRIAETEKYAHVTYFFNGLRERPFPNEYRILIPSQSVLHHDEHPEMMASQITDRALIALNEGEFDFILINYANPDIVAHTGNYNATIRAVKVVDGEIERLLKAVLGGGHYMLITGDHGNAEVVLDLRTGAAETSHNLSPVPIYLVNKRLAKTSPRDILSRLPVIGFLSDVAPTILELMKIPKPKEMTGQSLLEQLL